MHNKLSMQIQKQQRRSPRGFTLIEIMMVLAIIGVLIGGAITFTGGMVGQAEVTQAEKQIQTIGANLLGYKNLAGRFPTTEQGLQALITKPSSSPKPRRWIQSLKTIPTDPWQNDFIYKMPGSKDPKTYELISKGPDGVLGTDDDISSQDEAY